MKIRPGEEQVERANQLAMFRDRFTKVTVTLERDWERFLQS